jgi:hypothetical protein
VLGRISAAVIGGLSFVGVGRISIGGVGVVDGFGEGRMITDGNSPVEPTVSGLPAVSGLFPAVSGLVVAAALLESEVLVGTSGGASSSAGTPSAIGELLAALVMGDTIDVGTPAVDPTGWDFGAESAPLAGDARTSFAGSEGELDGLVG